MKPKILKSIALMACLSLFSFQCDEDDVNPNDNSLKKAAIELNMQDGTWRISSYVDSGQNETSDFAGYIFAFSSTGALIASNGAMTKQGIWSVNDDNSSDDDSNDDNDIDFNIVFDVAETDDFDDLNDDWDIVSHSSTQLQLRDVSGGYGSVDTLTFTKN